MSGLADAWNWWTTPDKAAWEEGFDLLDWRRLLRLSSGAVVALVPWLIVRAAGANPPGLYLWILFPVVIVQSAAMTIRRYQAGDVKQGNVQTVLTAVCAVLLIAWLFWQHG